MLSVVVPVKNEEDNILPLLEEIHAALDGRIEFEVIYVNDGSTDRTPEVLIQARGKFPRLRVVTHRASCGQSRAIASAVHAAKGDWIVTLDGDGQNDPADIPKLLGLWREGKFDLEGLITRTYPLEGINQGYEDMRNGKNIRGVLVMQH